MFMRSIRSALPASQDLDGVQVDRDSDA